MLYCNVHVYAFIVSQFTNKVWCPSTSGSYLKVQARELIFVQMSQGQAPETIDQAGPPEVPMRSPCSTPGLPPSKPPSVVTSVVAAPSWPPIWAQVLARPPWSPVGSQTVLRHVCALWFTRPVGAQHPLCQLAHGCMCTRYQLAYLCHSYTCSIVPSNLTYKTEV